jgi:hypothetical protein
MRVMFLWIIIVDDGEVLGELRKMVLADLIVPLLVVI